MQQNAEVFQDWQNLFVHAFDQQALIERDNCQLLVLISLNSTSLHRVAAHMQSRVLDFPPIV